MADYMKNPDDAKKAYTKHLDTIEERLAQLGGTLTEDWDVENPHWGHVGSAAHLAELLTEAVRFRLGDIPEESK